MNQKVNDATDPQPDCTKIIHVLSNTHWDREHRHGFQETRMMLVEAVDRLLEIIESEPDFKSFTFDGQTVVLEDYLEIRPGNRDRLKQHVSSGKILVGPWYSLPDCSAVHPESLIRNLLVGHRVAAGFGPVMKAGYSIFSFGQIEQLPQLYGEFDIDELIFYKGASPEVMKESEFIWEAPDGTRALCSRLGKDCRLNFFAYFTVPVLLGGHMMRPGWNVRYADETGLCHYIDRENHRHSATELCPDLRIREEEIHPAVVNVIQSVEGTVARKNLLAFDGIDFSTPLREIPAALRAANEIMKGEVTLIHSNLPDYFKAFREEVDLSRLRVFRGEARCGPISKVHSETLSGTMPIKLKLFAAEQELIQYAEVFQVAAYVSGGSYPADMFGFAWKYLLKAQSHDSIHGAGVDKITPDNLFRIAQVQEIAETLSRKAMESLVREIDTSSLDGDDLVFTVFNPLPVERSGILRLELDMPLEDYVREFRITDMSKGREYQCHVLKSVERNIPSVNPENRPKALYTRSFLVDADLPPIPPLGYRTFRIKRDKGLATDGPNPFGVPRYIRQRIGRDSRTLDNGVISVTVNPDATLKIYDYQTGRAYNSLHRFIDSGDCGNVWVHNPPPDNEVYDSRDAAHTCALVENSPLTGVLALSLLLKLPRQLSADRTGRCPEKTDFRMNSTICLRAGSRQIEFTTSVENSIRDHKLSLRFQPGIRADETLSDTSFMLKRRPVDPVGDDADPQSVIYRHPMQTFVDLSDSKGGITLITRGLHEFETGDTQNPFIDLTLLRGVSQDFPVHKDVMISSQEEYAQCPGLHRFEYALLVHSGGMSAGELAAGAARYIAPMRAMQHARKPGGRAPFQRSFLRTDHPATRILCLKKAEDSDALILRLNNPTESSIQECLRFSGAVARVWRCNGNEEVRETLQPSGCELRLELPAYKVVTLKFELVAESETPGHTKGESHVS